MLFTEIIAKKRDGAALDADEIGFFVSGLANQSLPPEQVSALAMAIFFRSLSFEETGALTRAMASSGRRLDWQALNLPGPVVDKHSTGGVGDKVSFLLAPIVAACGGFVPMVSGRGLGHTGGTLDKADAIPGYCATPDIERFQRVVRECGCAIIGQTSDIAPADRRLYAIRDVTGTVESIPLITASILSKKVAAGNQALVMDVKVGSGAFMETFEGAEALAQSIIGTAASIGLPTRALITDMGQTLGCTAGNALEIQESVDYLLGVAREPRLHEVTVALSAEMLLLTGLAATADEARAKVEASLASGKAAETFARMVTALGGPADFMERAADYLPKAPIQRPVFADEPGYLSTVNARRIGNAIITLGGGRRKVEDKLDLGVGLGDVVPIGTRVDQTRPLATIHAASEAHWTEAAALVKQACVIAPDAPPQTPVIHAQLG
ncbi:thymidine phosphorylase [Sphingopyxis sp. SE2]|uniref:thymidine phosphorylase n=1 Tax=Sphingopyxis sp. SE2 TaxID=1586240 RepID=UPI0028C04D4A|nr:thymidine phosphorylase [Sphingopyxis sp. SE2]MDT7531615.1 thymidine phosphorylase [Sphingopyxis sp. SE2]